MGDMDAKKDQLVGKAKELAGQATGDESTEAEGRTQQLQGQAKDLADTAKKKAADTAQKMKNMIK